MYTNGKELIKKAIEELVALNIVPIKIDTSINIDTAEGEELNNAVNYFLECVETVPENKEHLISKTIISLYNDIVDNNVSFETNNKTLQVIDVDNVIFRRTKFHD